MPGKITCGRVKEAWFGKCRFGRAVLQRGVVDDKCKVRVLQGRALHVLGAGQMPEAPRLRGEALVDAHGGLAEFPGHLVEVGRGIVVELEAPPGPRRIEMAVQLPRRVPVLLDLAGHLFL